MYRRGLKRHHVFCVKCGYEWMAYAAKPVRCAQCNNPNIDVPKRGKTPVGMVNENEYADKS